MNIFLSWLELLSDAPFQSSHGFWSSALGLFISGSICVCSAVNVLHPDIDDDLFDRCWYSTLSVLMLIAFLIGLSPTQQPNHVVKVLLIMLCIKYWVMLIQKLYMKHKVHRE